MLTAMIFAKDLDRMQAFYSAGFELGVDAAASSDGYVVLVGPNVRVALHRIPDAVAPRITIADPPEARGDTAIKLLFAVDDVEGCRRRLESHGGQLFETTTDDVVDVVDPEGNVLGLGGR